MWLRASSSSGSPNADTGRPTGWSVSMSSMSAPAVSVMFIEAPVSTAPRRQAPRRSAPLRSAPSRLLPLKLAPRMVARTSLQPRMTASVKSVWIAMAPDRRALVRLAPGQQPLRKQRHGFVRDQTLRRRALRDAVPEHPADVVGLLAAQTVEWQHGGARTDLLHDRAAQRIVQP